MATAQKTKSVKNYTQTVGRRREAVARVRLYNTPNGKAEINGVEYVKGDFIVNGKPVDQYFRFQSFGPLYTKIFNETNTRDKFIVSAKVAGGGLAGQMDAVIHGIARALDKIDSNLHQTLKDNGYLTRDSRTRERRKVGNAGKARRKKSSPKR